MWTTLRAWECGSSLLSIKPHQCRNAHTRNNPGFFKGTVVEQAESSGVRMIRISFFSAAVAILMSFCQGSSAHAAGPEEQLSQAVKVALGKNFNTREAIGV